mmetsp:Transcript_5897/g.14969  ORF Transcript_5897/g.14969 Transcript_5897/m.14969 type:complete len:216 (-) Transcript_5897:1388-2035(-)
MGCDEALRVRAKILQMVSNHPVHAPLTFSSQRGPKARDTMPMNTSMKGFTSCARTPCLMWKKTRSWRLFTKSSGFCALFAITLREAFTWCTCEWRGRLKSLAKSGTFLLSSSQNSAPSSKSDELFWIQVHESPMSRGTSFSKNNIILLREAEHRSQNHVQAFMSSSPQSSFCSFALSSRAVYSTCPTMTRCFGLTSLAHRRAASETRVSSSFSGE